MLTFFVDQYMFHGDSPSQSTDMYKETHLYAVLNRRHVRDESVPFVIFLCRKRGTVAMRVTHARSLVLTSKQTFLFRHYEITVVCNLRVEKSS